MTGKIFVVATPIGNLEDITYRAARILKEVDLVVAEDTRVSKKLLTHFRITKPIERFDEHISDSRINTIVQKALDGGNIALVTDAGTPNISDPGYRLINRALEEGIEDIVPIPGPSALTALVSVSHFPMDKFVFAGYPPSKKGRRKFFDTIAGEMRPVVLYESPHRVLKTIKELSDRVPDREAIVAKELTKIYERVWRGAIGDIHETLQTLKPEELKGEFVIGLAYGKKR